MPTILHKRNSTGLSFNKAGIRVFVVVVGIFWAEKTFATHVGDHGLMTKDADFQHGLTMTKDTPSLMTDLVIARVEVDRANGI
jgi:hypothetical protein